MRGRERERERERERGRERERKRERVESGKSLYKRGYTATCAVVNIF